MRFVRFKSSYALELRKKSVNAAVLNDQRHSMALEARVQPKRTAARPQSLRNSRTSWAAE